MCGLKYKGSSMSGVLSTHDKNQISTNDLSLQIRKYYRSTVFKRKSKEGEHKNKQIELSERTSSY